MLTWRPPKTTNGQINGYLIHYTTDRWANVRDWFVEAVVGDVTSARIANLSPDKKYFFKVSARNSKGYGPYSSVMSFATRGAATGTVAVDTGTQSPATEVKPIRSIFVHHTTPSLAYLANSVK